ncbi:MAG: hypothetical protein V4730_03220 [Pseudomonadota bacterium]
MTGRDLFSALRVAPISDIGPGTNASRIDIGPTAWRASQAPLNASRWQRWHFRLSLWQHFGKAKFLVQVGNSYHTATAVRIYHQPDQGSMDILLMQTSNIWQYLLGRLQQQLGMASTPWHKRLNGQIVVVSRYPDTLTNASVPMVDDLSYSPCPEVLLDSQHSHQLPLIISLSR